MERLSRGYSIHGIEWANEEEIKKKCTGLYNIHQDETHITLSFKTRHSSTSCVRNPDCIVAYDAGDTVCVIDILRSRIFALGGGAVAYG